MRTMKTPVRTATAMRRSPPPAQGRTVRTAGLSAAMITDALSFLFPFAMMLLILFNPQISPAGPALQILLTLAVAFFLIRTRPRALLAQGWILSIGLLCLGSAVWSVAPALSARAGAQVTLTLLSGVLIGLLPRQGRVITAIFAGFFLYVVVSLAIGGSVALGNSGAQAFSGLNSSKNYFAATVVFLMVAAVAMMAAATRWRRLALAVGGLALLVGAFALLDARSATAIIASAAGIALFGLAWLALRLPTRTRLVVIGVALFSITPLALVTEDIETAVVGGTLSTFDKNAGLTGRGALWKSADRIIGNRPLLGRGYYTFWVRGNPAAERLWFQNHIAGRYGFNFHNVQREVTVAIGWVGFTAMMLVIAGGVAILLVRSIFAPTLPMAFWFAIAGCILLRFGTEAVFPVPFAMETVLLAAALGYALAQLRGADAGSGPGARTAFRPGRRPDIPDRRTAFIDG